jgi:hypothetical protein
MRIFTCHSQDYAWYEGIPKRIGFVMPIFALSGVLFA